MVAPCPVWTNPITMWCEDIDRENNDRGVCCCMIFDPLNLWLESRESWSEPCPALPQPSPCWQPYPRTTPPWGSSLSVDGTHPTPSCAAPNITFWQNLCDYPSNGSISMQRLQILCNKCTFINGDDDAGLWQCVKWVKGGKGDESVWTNIYLSRRAHHTSSLSLWNNVSL